MSDAKVCKTIAVCTIAFAVACLVSTVTALSTMGTVYGFLPGAGEILTYLYQINAFFCVFAAALGWSVLKREGRSKRNTAFASMWGMLILSVMYYTPFVTDSVSYLASMDPMAAFRYLSAYLPFLTLVIALVGVISTWNSVSHMAASKVSVICSLVSVFASVVYLWQVLPAAFEAETTFDGAQIWAIVFGYMAVTMVCLECWTGTVDNFAFRQTFGGSDESGCCIVQNPIPDDEQNRDQMARETPDANTQPSVDKESEGPDPGAQNQDSDEMHDETDSEERTNDREHA